MLSADFNGSIFVVVHIPPWRQSDIPAILSRSGPLPAVHPRDGEEICRGKIYVAPPDLHMLVDSEITLWRGPKENRQRPSINALFRSAAVAYGKNVTGVVLSGLLDDGSAGLWWVKRYKGTAIVEDPYTAQYPQMPWSALEHVDADYVLDAKKIGSLLEGRAAKTDEPITM